MAGLRHTFDRVRPLLIFPALGVTAYGSTISPILAVIRDRQAKPLFVYVFVVAAVLGAIAWKRGGWCWGEPRRPPAPTSHLYLAGRCVIALVGIALLAASAYLASRPQQDDYVALTMWILGMIILAGAFYSANVHPKEILSRVERADAGIGLALFVGSAVTFTWGIGDWPWYVQSDETRFGLESLARRGADPTRIFSYGWLDHPRTFFELQAIAAQVIGGGVAALRYPSAISGALLIVATFAFVRIVFGRGVGIVAALLLLGSTFQQYYSRLGLNNATSELLFAVAFVLLAITFRTPRVFPAALTGLVAGLGLYFYFGSRPLPLVAAGTIALLAVVQPHLRLARLRQLGAMALCAVGAFAPMFPAFIAQPGDFSSRFILLSVATHQSPDGVVGLLGRDAAQSFLVFFAAPDQSQFFYHQPLMDALLGPAFVLAFGLMLFRLDDPRLLLAAAWFFPEWLAGGVIEAEVPYSPRIICAVPIAFALVAVVYQRGFDTLFLWIKPRIGAWLALGLPIALTLVIAYRQGTGLLTTWATDRAQEPWITRWEFARPAPTYLLVEGIGLPPEVTYPELLRGTTTARGFESWPPPWVKTLKPGATVIFYFDYRLNLVRSIDAVTKAFPRGQLTQLSGPNNLPHYAVYEAKVP